MKYMFYHLTVGLLTLTAANAAPLDTFRDCDVCPEMIELPLGEFMMGAPEGESRNNFHFFEGVWQRATPDQPFIALDEGPVHKITIDIPIAMGRNEVTYEEWTACVNDGGCNGYVPNSTAAVLLEDGTIQEVPAIGNHPVMRVSYYDALSYADWLNSKVGADVYRLPTEAEWEYAARAGTQTPFAQGELVTPDQVNYNGKATAENLGEIDDDYVLRWMTVPVDELDAANSWGLRHMSGNVSEVTMSCWSPRHRLWFSSKMHLEENLRTSSCARRVSRGGGYSLLMDESRVAAREPIGPDVRLPTDGFRILREMAKPES